MPLQITSDQRPSDYEYALLAKHIYDRPRKGDTLPQHPTWRVHQAIVGGYFASCGFYAALYKNVETRQAVLVFRGTSDTITWIENIYSIALNSVTSVQKLNAFAYVKTAIEYAQDENYQLSFTGHSLGAFLAELSVYFCHSHFAYPHVNAVTFESPGIREMVEKLDSEHEPMDLRVLDIISYVSYPNIVNTCNHHVGTVYSVEPIIDKARFGFFTGNVVEVHSMDNLLDMFMKSQLPTRSYMASWPRGRQKNVFQRYCQEVPQSADSHFIQYKLSLTQEAFQQAVQADNQQHYALHYEGQYQIDKALSHPQCLSLQHFEPNLQKYLKLFYKQAFTTCQDEHGVAHFMATFTKEYKLPQDIIYCLFGYTIKKNPRQVEYVECHAEGLTPSILRSTLSHWLSNNRKHSMALLDAAKTTDAGISLSVTALEEGAHLHTDVNTHFEQTGIDVAIPSNEEGAAYVERIAAPTLARLKSINVVGVPQGNVTITGKGSVSFQSTGVRFGMDRNAGESPSSQSNTSRTSFLASNSNSNSNPKLKQMTSYIQEEKDEEDNNHEDDNNNNHNHNHNEEEHLDKGKKKCFHSITTP